MQPSYYIYYATIYYVHMHRVNTWNLASLWSVEWRVVALHACRHVDLITYLHKWGILD